jgi:hypothetical protein
MFIDDFKCSIMVLSVQWGFWMLNVGFECSKLTLNVQCAI